MQSTDLLQAPIQYVKGVGPIRAKALQRLHIETIRDALFFLPRRYEDRSHLRLIAQLQVGTHETFRAQIRASTLRKTQRGRRFFEVVFGDDTGVIKALWFQFNQQYMTTQFTRGAEVLVSGDIRANLYTGQPELYHPDIEFVEGEGNELLHMGRIVPTYPGTEGLPQKQLRRIMKQVVDTYGEKIEETLPDPLRERLQLIPLREAIQQVHFPEDTADGELLNTQRSPGHRRLIFEELFFLELALALKKQGTLEEKKGISYQGKGILRQQLRQLLPYQLTPAQERVLQEITTDMQQPHPMNRLLQGDVGSGKTIVALFAILTALESGYQAAIMAPTEILAEQHYVTLYPYLERLECPMALLTSNVRGAKRAALLSAIAQGTIPLVVGTHALIQEDVHFAKLGLVIIDEQHRFGVLQRASLIQKGYHPDVLVMTATPIPRTLTMTVYGDLDVSVIDQLPPGRMPITTRLFYEKNRPHAYELVRSEIEAGRQAYLVYPLVEESEKLELKAATAMAVHLKEAVFPHFTIALLHGRMRSEEKEAVMRDFAAGSIDILISTTVIEVGIDIPNATVMVIEHAERFGLSQLHQLRGRVGRGSQRSYCLLLAHFPMSEEAKQRLQVMVESQDGFDIAEKDLEIRGPGEFMGTRQSGLPELQFADLVRHQQILQDARREAFRLVKEDPHLTRYPSVKARVEVEWLPRLSLMDVG
jgi:ATP-dependent DNA helicase RecG